MHLASLVLPFTLVAGSWARLSDQRKLKSAYCDEHYEVVIVGAGIAGLTAAKTLNDAGVDSFVVLELFQKVGGRMRTINNTVTGFENKGDFQGLLEAGANWMNGGRGFPQGNTNPIKAIADEVGTEYFDMSYESITAFDEGRPVRSRKLDRTLFRLNKAYGKLDGIGDALYKDFESGNEDPSEDQRASEALQNGRWPWVADTPLENVLENYYFSQDFLLKTEDVSLYNFPDEVAFDFGKQDNFVKDQAKGGVQGISQAYADGFLAQDSNLFLGVEVTMIRYDKNLPEGEVTIETSECSLSASRVIYTPGVGVIEKYKGDRFDPPIDTEPLPLVMGTWTKVFFQFDIADDEEPFWDIEKQWILLGTQDTDNCNVWLNYDFQSVPKKTNKLLPGSKILACLMDQDTIDRFGGQEDYVIRESDFDGLLGDLRAAYGVLPSYTAYATNWLEDPCAYGSWENWKYDTNSQGLQGYYDFFTPTSENNGRFFLSGSPSCLRYWGFMKGGYFGGIKSANWALNYMASDATMPYSPCDDLDNIQGSDYTGSGNGKPGKGKGRWGSKI